MRANLVIKTTENGAITVKNWDAPSQVWAFEDRAEAAAFIASKLGVILDRNDRPGAADGQDATTEEGKT